MVENKDQSDTNPFEHDHTRLWKDPVTKQSVSVAFLYRTFQKYKDDPSQVIQLALVSIFNRVNRDPEKSATILKLIPDGTVRISVQKWCEQKGVKFRAHDSEKKISPEELGRLFAHDEQLIASLGPYISQTDLSRIIQLLHFRQASEETKQVLISGIYRMLGEYLGPRRQYRREVPTDWMLPLPEIAPEIFEDELIRTILTESQRRNALPIFERDFSEGRSYISDLRDLAGDQEAKLKFVDDLGNHFEHARQLQIPGINSEIYGDQKDIPLGQRTGLYPFPAFHQLEYAYRFITKEIGPLDFFESDPRTRKTKCMPLAFKAAGAKCPVIICPAGVRTHWERELRETFTDEILIVTIKNNNDFIKRLGDNPRRKKPDYIIISYPFLSNFEEDPQIDLWKAFFHSLEVDALGVDETHLANNPNARCTEQIIKLSGLLSAESPRIVMTGTGLINGVEDLDAPIRILMPHRYNNPGEFTRAARNNPAIVASLLQGQQLLTRVTMEDIYGDRLPKVTSKELAIPLSYFHRSIYALVHQDSTIEAQFKRGMLRQASLDPLLIRRHYAPHKIDREIAKLAAKLNQPQDDFSRDVIEARIKSLEERKEQIKNLCSLEQATKLLSEAYKYYNQWVKVYGPIKFNEDFLVQAGMADLALWAFLNHPKGMAGVITQLGLNKIQTVWENMEVYSSKYQALFDKIEEHKAQGQHKFIIYSGVYQTDVTSSGEGMTEEDWSFESLFDQLTQRYGKETVLRIDGTVSLDAKPGKIAKREQTRIRFRTDSQAEFLVATTRSSRLGIDLSIPATKENSQIQALVQIFLDKPDTYADFFQAHCRGLNPNQKIPIYEYIFQATDFTQPETPEYGTIDHGIHQALEFKRLLSQMVLDGIPLTEEEEKFVKAHLSNIHTGSESMTPSRFMHEVLFKKVRGKGFDYNRELFRQMSGFEGLTHGEFFQLYYPFQDQITLPGHNARAVSEIIRTFEQNQGLEHPLIASIGCGAGILQLSLGQRVTNVDMLPEILRIAEERQIVAGEFIEANAAKLPLSSGKYDVVEAGLMIHWSSNRPYENERGKITSERVDILVELNRIARQGGLISITIPSTHLTAESFLRWKGILTQFGGYEEYSKMPSGLIRATDFRTEAVSWVFNLMKARPFSLEFNPRLLDLDFEPITDIIETQNRRGSTDILIDIKPPLPHFEFAIDSPNGKEQRLIYKQPEIDISTTLIGSERRVTSEGVVYTDQLGIKQREIYDRLVNYGQRWQLKNPLLGDEEINSFVKRALWIWANTNYSRNSTENIWPELKSIMDLIMKGKYD